MASTGESANTFIDSILDRVIEILERLIRTLEGEYLSQTSRDQITADTQKGYEARCRRYRLGNYAHLALLFVVAAGAVIGFYEAHPIFHRILLLVVMPAVFFELLLRLKWRAEEHNVRLEAPQKSFDLAECARILRRIRQTKVQLSWYAVTVIGGAVSLFLQTTPVPGGRSIRFLSTMLWIHIYLLIRRLTGLRPELIKVERELQKIDKLNENAERAELRF